MPPPLWNACILVSISTIFFLFVFFELPTATSLSKIKELSLEEFTTIGIIDRWFSNYNEVCTSIKFSLAANPVSANGVTPQDFKRSLSLLL